MKAIVISLLCALSGVSLSAIVPFRDSVEVVFTPDDIKKGTDYVLWKVPTVKNNFKTTVKQKLLNRLLSKDLQELKLNSPFPEDGLPEFKDQRQSVGATKEIHAPSNIPLQNIQLEVLKPKGLVNSVLKGPSTTEKTLGKVRYVDEDKGVSQQAVGSIVDPETKDATIQKMQKDLDEHVGYLKPKNIKNRKHNFDTGMKYRSEEGEEEAEVDTDCAP